MLYISFKAILVWIYKFIKIVCIFVKNLFKKAYKKPKQFFNRLSNKMEVYIRNNEKKATKYNKQELEMIDFHAHILPDTDDGAVDIIQTRKMLEEARMAGFTDIIATSHYKKEVFELNEISRQNRINIIEKIAKTRHKSKLISPSFMRK